MSKLAKAIKYSIHNNQVALKELDLKYTDVSKNVVEIPWSRVYEVSIGVKLEAKGHVDTAVRPNFNPFEETLINVKRALIEEAFGEFRPLIQQLHVAIAYEHDLKKAQQLLTELDYKMFQEGL